MSWTELQSIEQGLREGVGKISISPTLLELDDDHLKPLMRSGSTHQRQDVTVLIRRIEGYPLG